MEDTDEPTNLEPDQLRIGILKSLTASSYIFLELITLEILRSLSASSYILPQVYQDRQDWMTAVDKVEQLDCGRLESGC